jgi:SAM-dependent methyltransferase
MSSEPYRGSSSVGGAQHEAAKKTYETAVSDGFYTRDASGLQGKYDNVRRYWEDQITRYALHGFIGPLVARKRRELSRIRVLDLGAGAGEGYKILTSLKRHAENLGSTEVEVLPADILGCYKGVDISQAMVEQGRAIYALDPKVQFAIGDLADGLGPLKNDRPYDIYFSSYGSLCHLRDEQLRGLIEDIYDHFDGSCILIADLIGRYSFEWQCHWDTPTGETNMRQYSMSYLYPAEMLDVVEVERFPLRYWGADEFDAFIREIMEEKGGRVAKAELRDRSVVVGRHMNTGEFNPRVQPIRASVNCLHELDHRTDLESLLFDYAPEPGYTAINAFFESFQMAWNAVVYAAIEALERWDDPKWLSRRPPEEYPDPVQGAIRTIRNVIGNVQWFRMGDPRANVVEPQLGYILRNLEMDLQQGLGAAHGLLAIYVLEKP